MPEHATTTAQVVAPPPPNPGWFARGAEWFTRSGALAGAKKAGVLTPRQQEWLGRADCARELAGRALEPDEPLRSGPGDSVAIELYRQAIYWRLATTDSDEEDPARLWEQAVPGSLQGAAGGEESLQVIRQLITARNFREASAIAAPAIEAKDLRLFTSALFSHHDSGRSQLLRLRRERTRRIGLAGVLLAAFAALAGFGIYRWTNGPDLTATATWKASSTLSRCPLETGVCRGKKMKVFFYTNKQKHPWVEYDFEKPKKFGRVELTNRSDCCGGRAVPLVIEVSNDRKKWQQVAERKKPFAKATLKFKTSTGRYLRVRSTKTTPFHLEQVSVFLR